ncbi:MAG TPA: SDR family oxidoreductase [Gemmatimonadales bacterium]|jgi:thioester reductase-like protein|nr:SDR family oxidoreductase [Gemmatimonadales bacterium]
MILVTGATGLVGGGVLARLLAADRNLRVAVLVRDLRRWVTAAARLGVATDRVLPVVGDLLRPGLGLDVATRARLQRELTAVVHAAADIVFSRPLDVARATNVEGTRRVVELAAACPEVRRLAFISTAFVAGRACGRIAERDNGADTGWVNAYEQSKYEAEQLVRAVGGACEWVIFRPAAIVCDAPAGQISQVNSVHLALRLLYHGLVPMIPGSDDAPIDVVTAEFVADAVARLALHPDVAGRVLHLCAGAGALPLRGLFDLTWRTWAADPAWRRKDIAQPVIADLDTYALFARSVEATADEPLKRAMRSLSHFVPQLAHAKRFDTTEAEAALGHAPPAVETFWTQMSTHLLTVRWPELRREEAA